MWHVRVHVASSVGEVMMPHHRGPFDIISKLNLEREESISMLLHKTQYSCSILHKNLNIKSPH